ncbi:hypothetical protein SCA6_009575 [Theobroma cacao]
MAASGLNGSADRLEGSGEHNPPAGDVTWQHKIGQMGVEEISSNYFPKNPTHAVSVLHGNGQRKDEKDPDGQNATLPAPVDVFFNREPRGPVPMPNEVESSLATAAGGPIIHQSFSLPEPFERATAMRELSLSSERMEGNETNPPTSEFASGKCRYNKEISVIPSFSGTHSLEMEVHPLARCRRHSDTAASIGKIISLASEKAVEMGENDGISDEDSISNKRIDDQYRVDPSEANQTNSGWNPTVTCPRERMEDYVNNPPTQESTSARLTALDHGENQQMIESGPTDHNKPIDMLEGSGEHSPPTGDVTLQHKVGQAGAGANSKKYFIKAPTQTATLSLGHKQLRDESGPGGQNEAMCTREMDSAVLVEEAATSLHGIGNVTMGQKLKNCLSVHSLQAAAIRQVRE